MPHLHVEYTPNLAALEPQKLLLRLNHALVATGQFAHEADIKARATAVEVFQVGTMPAERGFIYARLAILSGRPEQVKKTLSDALLEVLKGAAPWPPGLDVQFGVDIVDMDRASYGKARIGG
ncbi:5-carboxymethyl-2-hydroxymuconate Delta-isomerase [Pseudomonas typographi]|uniref:5-carboxymethyl-2-hydroxymuconate Delta-isomerase n=1 Tax=Pseudomonas typographi TaxID=2715964 RepID=A0ABR7Z594_9PSED|nr:5-carboxymethyl-2-hydroxymuconate Delta-isomerase [Pseudomonas typographi]MBD1600645.1 5-carboxymethyl-2-hydroxymuconate Delta-isomerase [Pseudomonas typographi]